MCVFVFEKVYVIYASIYSWIDISPYNIHMFLYVSTFCLFCIYKLMFVLHSAFRNYLPCISVKLRYIFSHLNVLTKFSHFFYEKSKVKNRQLLSFETNQIRLWTHLLSFFDNHIRKTTTYITFDANKMNGENFQTSYGFQISKFAK